MLLVDSLKDNIYFSDGRPDLARIELCARLAQVDADIERMRMTARCTLHLVFNVGPLPPREADTRNSPKKTGQCACFPKGPPRKAAVLSALSNHANRSVNLFFAYRKRCPLNIAIHNFVDTEHFNSAEAFREIAGNEFRIGDNIAYDDT
jgi:hypothetical protein